MNKIKISQKELKELLLTCKGATICTIIADTDPRLKADGPKDVRKISKVNGIINWIYERSVNRQREREGSPTNFEALPRNWGERLSKTPLVAHKGKYYVEIKVQHATTEYKQSNRRIDVRYVTPYLPKRSTTRQNLNKEVILRDYSLENIMEIHMGGKQYVVEK